MQIDLTQSTDPGMTHLERKKARKRPAFLQREVLDAAVEASKGFYELARLRAEAEHGGPDLSSKPALDRKA